jgi:hypothetical protein
VDVAALKIDLADADRLGSGAILDGRRWFFRRLRRRGRLFFFLFRLGG